MRARLFDRALEALSLVSLAVWLGGLAVLGAVAAPLVFGIVPPPYGASAMTAVFRRFDGVAVSSAAVVLLVEAAQAYVRRSLSRLDVIRAIVAAVAAALAVVQATLLSPRIEALHRGGAVRGLGAAGLELDAVHHAAEAVAKGELGLLIAVLAMHALRPSARVG
jgi:hypothetical protein